MQLSITCVQQFPCCVSVPVMMIRVLLGLFPLCFKTGSQSLHTWYIHDTSMLIPGKEGTLQEVQPSMGKERHINKSVKRGELFSRPLCS